MRVMGRTKVYTLKTKKSAGLADMSRVDSHAERGREALLLLCVGRQSQVLLSSWKSCVMALIRLLVRALMLA